MLNGEVQFRLVPGIAMPLTLTRPMAVSCTSPFRVGESLYGPNFAHRLYPRDVKGEAVSVWRPGVLTIRQLRTD